MADDPYARIAQLEARLAASQEREAALAAEVEQRDRTLADAREEQRATADVLRVIAASPTDLQAIMQTIVDSVVRLCGGDFAFIDRIDGDDLVRVANVLNDLDPPWPVGQRLPPGSGGPAQRAIRQAVAEGRTVSWMREIDDVGPPGGRYFPRAGMAFPLSRETTTIGALVVSRGAREPFSDQQISLLEAFADQAVIAMENARLFQELDARNAELHESNRQVTDALEQQTATANVLRVIASSPTDVQLVLDTVAESALRLCGANQVAVYRLQEGLLRFAATGRPDTEGNSVRLGLRQGVLPSREFVAGRAVLDQRTVHVLDLQTDADFPLGQQMATASGHRTTLGVPLLSEGVAIGALSISHKTVRPFTEQQIALVESFADQSVIAIENARLFAELEQRNRELSEALEQQTATSEILRIIASTPADLRRVLESLAEHAARLCEAENVSILRVEDDVFVSAAMRGNLRTPTDEYTIPVSSGSVAGLAVVERRTVHIPDMEAADPAFPITRDLRALQGTRSVLAAPLLRYGVPLGAIVILRTEALPFTDQQIGLLETFADQAVIAIENARLFEELQEANRQLGEANEKLAEASHHKSQFLANMSHELRTPLNAIIGYSEMLQEEAEDTGDEASLPDLRRINSAGKHLLGLINDILDLSKIEAGRMDLFLETFSIPHLIRDVQAIVQPLVEKNGNALVIECPDDIGSMHADQTKLRQALFNLLSNAAKFTDHGTITLRVTREAPSPVRGRGETDGPVPPPPQAGRGLWGLRGPMVGSPGGGGSPSPSPTPASG